MAKKYYWLKLNKDFFKRHDIRIVEDMENGKDYVLFYLKLLLESITHQGELRFSETIPYNEKMLSTITNTNVDIVRSAIKLFTELKLMEIYDNGTFYLNQIETMTGNETEWAEKKRLYRDSKRTIKGQKRTMSDKSKRLEIELDIEKDIIHTYNSTCKKLPAVAKVSEKRKSNINALLKEFDIEQIKSGFVKASKSDFLNGVSGKWKANFDWLINKNNLLKVIEGNYDNNGKKCVSDINSKNADWEGVPEL